MAEGERPQERPQCRRCVRPGEDPAHPAVSKQRHVVDAVGTRDHARDQRGDLQPRVGTLVGRHGQVLIGQIAQARRLRQCERRNQPGRRHQVRIVEHRRCRPKRVKEFHLRDVPCVRSNRCLKNSDSPATQGHSRSTPRSPSHFIGGSRLKDGGEQVAGVVDPAALVRHALEAAPQRLDESRVLVRDHQSFTPPSPRCFRLVMNPRQKTSSSLSPTSSPRISRCPVAVTPVATTTAIEVTCWLVLRTWR